MISQSKRTMLSKELSAAITDTSAGIESATAKIEDVSTKISDTEDELSTANTLRKTENDEFVRQEKELARWCVARQSSHERKESDSENAARYYKGM